jgi:hypothetical protein
VTWEVNLMLSEFPRALSLQLMLECNWM